jgi:hypothetical protein
MDPTMQIMLSLAYALAGLQGVLPASLTTVQARALLMEAINGPPSSSRTPCGPP